MSQQNETICSKCGAENRPGARFCARCNNPLTAGASAGNAWQPQPPPVTPPRPIAPYRPLPTRNNRRMILLLVGIGLGITVLMVILASLLLPNDNDGELAAGTGTPAGTITPTLILTLTPTPISILAPTLPVTNPTPTIPTDPTLIPTPIGNNLLQNGDFLQPWNALGWQRDTSPTISNPVTESQLLSAVSSGKALYLRRTGPGYLTVWQTIAVVPSQLLLSGQLKASGVSIGGTTDEGTAGLMLIYRRADTTPIAWSIWVNGSDLGHQLPAEGDFPAVGPSVTWHGAGEDWYPLNVNLRDEFASRFPAIPFEQVAQIEVVLFSAGTAGCPPDGCLAELWVADLVLLQN